MSCSNLNFPQPLQLLNQLEIETNRMQGQLICEAEHRMKWIQDSQAHYLISHQFSTLKEGSDDDDDEPQHLFIFN